MMGIVQCWLLLLGLFSVQQQTEATKDNLAQTGTATQSSTHYSQSAEKAIDGGTDSSTSSGSCATTSWESKPWWRLDLQAAYQVNIVVIYRGDNFPGNTKNIQVKFGNSLQNNGNCNPRCAVLSSDAAANRVMYSCSDLEGRYINIYYNDWWNFLSVCEVEVYEIDSSRQSFMKIVFSSTTNLSDLTVTDSVLKELKSALAVRGITNVTLSWSQTPEKLMIHNQHENDPC